MSAEEKQILDEIRDRLGKIEHYLYNDTDTGKDGIVKSFERLHHRVLTLEEKEKIQKAKAGFWGGMIGGIVFGVVEILKLLFK